MQNQLNDTRNLEIMECSVEDLITEEVISQTGHASTAKCRFCSYLVYSEYVSCWLVMVLFVQTPNVHVFF